VVVNKIVLLLSSRLKKGKTLLETVLESVYHLGRPTSVQSEGWNQEGCKHPPENRDFLLRPFTQTCWCTASAEVDRPLTLGMFSAIWTRLMHRARAHNSVLTCRLAMVCY